MCEKATSHLFKVSTREIVVHSIDSHSATRAALSIGDKDTSYLEVEWIDGKTAPSIRFGDQDEYERQLIRDLYSKKFPTRIALINFCVARNKNNFLDLRGLTSAEGLVLPESVGGSLDLRGLTSADGLVLPKIVGGYLELSGLTSAEGLVLPKIVGGSLYLRGLTSAKGLVLPESFSGYLELSENVRKELENR